VEWILSLGYAQKYMSFGRDLNQGDATLHPEISAEWPDSGLSAGVWGAFAAESRATWREWDEYDFYLGYGGNLFNGQPYALDYQLTYTFLYYPRIKAASGNRDSHQFALTLSLPELLPGGDKLHFAPYAGLYYDRGVAPRARAGIDETVFRLGLDAFFAETPDSGYNAFVETYYNDGQREGEEPGWSHLLGGLLYHLDWGDCRLTPGMYYQWSWEPTLNPEHDFWVSFQISRRF
jgi:hypothetical protein